MEVILDFENFYLPDFETSFEVLCEFKSGHICTNYVHRTSISVINKFYANFFYKTVWSVYIDGANLQMQTGVVSPIMR